MLETLRNASKTWISRLLLMLLVGSFAIWGVNDIFTPRVDTTLARVGSAEIDQREYEAEFQRYVRVMGRQIGSELTLDQARAFGMDRTVLETMTSDRALDARAADLGLTYGDEALRARITRIPAFQGPGGQFDINAFAETLREFGYSEAGFTERFRRDVTRQQMTDAVMAGAVAPAGMLDLLRRYETERRVVRYLRLPASVVGDIPAADDATLEAYLRENAGRFNAPERRTLTYISVGPEDFTSQVTITDDEIRQLYELNKARFETPEKRTLEQIAYQTREQADAARAKIEAGATFEAVGTEAGLTPEEMAIGEVAKGDPSVPADAFNLELDAVSAPLESPFGWVLIKVTKITPGLSTPYEDAAAQLREAVMKERALDLVYPKGNEIEDLRAGGSSLEDIAHQLQLGLHKAENIDATGKGPSDAEPEGLLADPRFLEDAFNTDLGMESELGETRDKVYYVLRVDTVTPAGLKPLAEIRAEVEAAWREDQVRQRLEARAEEIASRGNAGTSFDALATELQAEAKTTEPIARGSATDEFSASLVAAVFGAAKDTLITGAPAEGDGLVLAVVTEIGYASAGDSGELSEQIRAATDREIAGDFAQQFSDATESTIGVEINEQMFAAMRERDE